MNEILELARELVSKLEECGISTGVICNSKVQLSELNVGDRFKTDIGTFIVLEQSTVRRDTKVIMKDFYKEEVKFDSNCTDYKESELKALCDTEILTAFEKEFGAENIIEHTASLTTVDMQTNFGTVDCKVRPITFDEARQYNDLLVNKDLPDWYWTCTPWSTKERGWEYSVAVVTPSGNVRNGGYVNFCGVRPFCILNSNIFVSKED